MSRRTAPTRDAALLRRLREGDPLIWVELRPPRTGLSYSESLDQWLDLYHAVRSLTRRDSYIFITDNAVGESEEENLRHLTANLAGDIDPSRVVPFLTCKHSLEYCLLYADRAVSHGYEALTVVGGDERGGRARCLEHGYMLRERIRTRVPGLTLGGWANPHRDPAEQVGYLLADDFTAEFFLTQVVSHHHIERVERFVRELRERNVPHPGVFGVFYYRSANPRTLSTLSRFFPVPVEEITREFEAGTSPEELCARTIVALREIGIDRVYVSNLGYRGAAERLQRIEEAVDAR